MIVLGFILGVLMVSPGAAGQRQTPGSNIEASQCNPHRHYNALQAPHPWIDPYGIHHAGLGDFPVWDGFLAISYRNRAQQAATEVDFGLVARHSLIETAKDVGVFSPGALIEHEFSVSREIFPIGTARPFCAVLRVKYADGSEWINPRASQE